MGRSGIMFLTECIRENMEVVKRRSISIKNRDRIRYYNMRENYYRKNDLGVFLLNR